MPLSSARTNTAANGQPDLTIPPHLARPLARLAVIGLRELARRDGGPLLLPGLASLLAKLDMTACGHAPAMLAAGAHDTPWVVVREASALTGIPMRSVRRLAADGKVRARRAGRDWLIDRHGIEDYARTMRRTRAAGRGAADGPDGELGRRCPGRAGSCRG